MGFHRGFNYSSCNEDWRTERRALQVGPEHRVLCVTGSGDRPLHLLLDSPRAIVAIDANPWQTRLLELKSAALRTLRFDDYTAFLGLDHAHTDRLKTLERLPLRPPTRRALGEKLRGLRAGVLYAGRWERHYRRVRHVARALRGALIDELFAFRDLDAQRAFVEKRWDTWFWRRVFDLMTSPLFSRVALRDPAFYAHIDGGFEPGRYVFDGMRRVLLRYLARENFMLSLIFRGELSPYDLPPYLREDDARVIKERLDVVEPVTANLLDYLASVPPRSFDRFSLSDVPSYLPQAEFERLLELLARGARPGARFCIRLFLTSHTIPERLASRFIRECPLEDELRDEDRAFAYRFLVGQVAP